MYAYIYIYIYIYIYVCVCVCVCVCVYTYLECIYACACACKHVYLCIYAYIYTCATHTRHFATAALCTTRSPFRRMCACVRSRACKHIYLCTYIYTCSIHTRCSTTAELCTPRSLSSVSSIRYVFSKITLHTYTLSSKHKYIWMHTYVSRIKPRTYTNALSVHRQAYTPSQKSPHSPAHQNMNVYMDTYIIYVYHHIHIYSEFSPRSSFYCVNWL